MRLLLISHAATSGSAHPEIAGGTLSDAAVARATEVGRALPQARAAFTSAAPAAVETAQALGLTPCPDPELRDQEANEPLAALIERVETWLARREGEQGTRAAVTHVAVIRAAVLQAMGAPARQFGALDIAPCSVTVLSFREDHWRLVRLNWEPALLHIPQRRSRRRPKPA
jgi:broad specificity phosphatase PhoE